MSTKTSKVYIKGSKIPITILFDYIIEGYGISEFLSAYPWVKRSNVVESLGEMKKISSSSNYAL